MSIPLKVKSNPIRTYPQDGDTDYGAQATQLMADVVGAVNNTPNATNSIQFDAVVGTSAATRTHSSLQAVLADAAIVDGMCVLIQEGTYTVDIQLLVNKRLFITGLGSGSVLQTDAGIASGAIFKITADGSAIKNIVLDRGTSSADYALELDAENCSLDMRSTGTYAISDIKLTSGSTTLVGFFVTDTNATLYGTASGGANQNLSNLLSPTAINQSIIPSADNTYDIGTAIKKWKKAYIGEIASTTIGATTGNITTVASTTVGATTGNITTANITTANLTNTNMVSATTKVTIPTNTVQSVVAASATGVIVDQDFYISPQYDISAGITLKYDSSGGLLASATFSRAHFYRLGTVWRMNFNIDVLTNNSGGVNRSEFDVSLAGVIAASTKLQSISSCLCAGGGVAYILKSYAYNDTTKTTFVCQHANVQVGDRYIYSGDIELASKPTAYLPAGV